MTHLTANATLDEDILVVAAGRDIGGVAERRARRLTHEGRGEAQELPEGWEETSAAPERVAGDTLAQMIDECARLRPEISIAWLCGRSKVGRNTIRSIMRRQRAWVDVYVADRLCVALGRHLSEAEPVEYAPLRGKRK